MGRLDIGPKRKTLVDYVSFPKSRNNKNWETDGETYFRVARHSPGFPYREPPQRNTGMDQQEDKIRRAKHERMSEGGSGGGGSFSDFIKAAIVIGCFGVATLTAINECFFSKNRGRHSNYQSEYTEQYVNAKNILEMPQSTVENILESGIDPTVYYLKMPDGFVSTTPTFFPNNQQILDSWKRLANETGGYEFGKAKLSDILNSLDSVVIIRRDKYKKLDYLGGFLDGRRIIFLTYDKY